MMKVTRDSYGILTL